MALIDIRERKHAVQAVKDVVAAMRATAAGRIQGAQRAMAAARRYREVVVRALLASRLPDGLPSYLSDSGSVLLIVFLSEQPLCGGFNHAIVEHALAAHSELSRNHSPELVVVGQRGSRVMAARGLAAQRTEIGATSLSGLRELTRRLSRHADRALVSGKVSEIQVIYGRYRSVSEQAPTTKKILPLDASVLSTDQPIPAERKYLRYLADPQLLAGLVSEYAFISLYHAAAESYASEQASRLVAMDGATRNTERMVEELSDLERRERQQDITRQVLEQAAARGAQEG